MRHDKLRVVEHMQDVIEAHLDAPVTLAMLTRGTGYSMYHASRMFKEITGETPFSYLRKRRLTAAAERLTDKERRVLDVAFDFVFDSHEGFTRAFSRQFGMTPASFMEKRPPLPMFLPPKLRDYYVVRHRGETFMSKKKSDLRTVFVQILERPKRQIILKRAKEARHYFEYCKEVGCGVWDTLAEIDNAIHEPMGLWLPKPFRPDGTSKYVQGVEVGPDWNGTIPEGFEIISLPPCRMLVFQGPPFEDEKFETAIEEVWDVMADYRPETIGYRFADEDGPRFQLIPLGERGYIEGRPVRRC